MGVINGVVRTQGNTDMRTQLKSSTVLLLLLAILVVALTTPYLVNQTSHFLNSIQDTTQLNNNDNNSTNLTLASVGNAPNLQTTPIQWEYLELIFPIEDINFGTSVNSFTVNGNIIERDVVLVRNVIQNYGNNSWELVHRDRNVFTFKRIKQD